MGVSCVNLDDFCALDWCCVPFLSQRFGVTLLWHVGMNRSPYNDSSTEYG